ncbi:hypothetical protein [Zobellia amurskyensis]|uniref:hypothetical protein n=1 Tax=Zobellia amurskyensis TaxID=248905 RepID=UPI0012D85949|nr:hypothetical protein [Zobellia amurskyensis]
MRKCLFMFGLLVVILIAAALTDTGDIKKLNSDLIVGEQLMENTLVAQEEVIQKPQN